MFAARSISTILLVVVICYDCSLNNTSGSVKSAEFLRFFAHRTTKGAMLQKKSDAGVIENPISRGKEWNKIAMEALRSFDKTFRGPPPSYLTSPHRFSHVRARRFDRPNTPISANISISAFVKNPLSLLTR